MISRVEILDINALKNIIRFHFNYKMQLLCSKLLKLE